MKSTLIRYILLYCCLLSFQFSIAQTAIYSNLHTKTIDISQAITPIGDLLIFPESLIIEGNYNGCYTYDALTRSIKWIDSCVYPGLVTIRYRVLPSIFSTTHRLPGYQRDSNFVFPMYNQDEIRNPFVRKQSLDYSGSYGRSMNVGNNQQLNLNSNFNMQMSGYIIDSIRVEGAITDNNLPFQPEGNTQRLQEFDKVYITLEKVNHKLTLGDHNLDNPPSHFLRFQKRVQGVSYEGKSLSLGNTMLHSLNSISISKGQFARNIFDGIEGTQGPYKLRTNTGAQFFIILAGTERVYIDGVLLSRGEDRDYIINYNLGEIIFMPRIMITKDKRIQVEFEYQDRNYLNSLIYSQQKLRVSPKMEWMLQLYANQDAKNQPFLQELNDDQKRILRSVGDNIENAYYTSAIIDTPGANKILYRMKDTTVSSINYDSIYEYSTDKNQTLYQLNFSFVGTQKGNYIIATNNANGRSYQWVAPIDNIPQGNYEPVILIVTPKAHRVVSLAGRYKIDSFKTIEVESSLSNYNPNLFSDIPISEHLGSAHRISYSESRKLSKSDTARRNSWIWSNALQYEMVQKKYRAISPFRNVEFYRDWNIVGDDSTNADDHLAVVNSSITKEQLGSISTRLSWYRRGNAYNGIRHLIAPIWKRKNNLLGAKNDYLLSRSSLYTTRFWRPSIYAERIFTSLSNTAIGARYELEDNHVKDATSDVLSPLSYSFNVYNAYIKNETNPDIDFNLSYTLRQDRRVKQTQLRDQNEGHTIDASANIHKSEDHQIAITSSYRILKVSDSSLSIDKPGTALLGRLSYNGDVSDGVLQVNATYEFGSGQEQKRAFTFVEVPVGQGFFYWIDYNNDGVQQANEFEQALYPDQKKYIKIITPTNEYNKVNFNQYNLSIDLNPTKLNDSIQDTWKWVKKFQNTLSIMGNGRYLIGEGINGYIPAARAHEDTNIVVQSLSILNNLYFHRDNSRFGMVYTYALTQGAQLLTYGLERNRWGRHSVLIRNNYNKTWSSLLTIKHSTRSYASGVDDGRSYDYHQYGIHPAINYMYAQRLRMSLSYEYDRRINANNLGGERAIAHAAKADMRISFRNIGSLYVNGSLTHLQYSGDDKSPRAFAILESLRKGQNYIWSLQYDTRLTKNLELSIQYDGRKPGELKAIHTGKMSIRALL